MGKPKRQLARDLINQVADEPIRRTLNESVAAELAATKSAQIVRTLRERGGLTQKQLADALGVTQQRVNYLEAGKAKQGPTLNTIEKIAWICNQRVSLLIEQAPEQGGDHRKHRIAKNLSFGG